MHENLFSDWHSYFQTHFGLSVVRAAKKGSVAS